MPYFADKRNKLTIGDFEVWVEPIGKIRKYRLIRKWLPYFLGDLPRMNLIINKSKNANSVIPFKAALHVFTPNNPSEPSTWAPSLTNRRTPFKEEIKATRRLTRDGIYEYEVTISTDGSGIEGGTSQVASLPVKVLEFITWSWLERILLILIGVLLTLLVLGGNSAPPPS